MERSLEKRAAYLYPKVSEAIADPTRQRILKLLAERHMGTAAFTEIKREAGVKHSSGLAHHLNVLQRAWLIERTTDLSAPRTSKNPYYCFYSLTRLGEEVAHRVLPSIEASLETALSSASA